MSLQVGFTLVSIFSKKDKARDINDYSADEIRRIMRRAFKIAQGRGKKGH